MPNCNYKTNKKPMTRTRNRISLPVALVGLSTAAHGQSPNIMNITPDYETAHTNHPPLVQAQIESSFTGSGKTEFLGEKTGGSESSNASANLFFPIPLNEKWLIPLGLGSQNISLNSVPRVPVPNRINTFNLTTSLGHRVNEDAMLMGIFSSTLYKFSDVGGNDIGFSGAVTAMWRYSPSLTFRFGAMFSPDSDLQVLPMVGTDWQINEQWHLRLTLPEPRLIYYLAHRWRFHVGASVVGTTFRASNKLGTSIGLPHYNDALGTYRDIRIGAGASYQFDTMVGAEVEAGYSVSRQIDYTRIDEKVKFAPAPYLRVAVRINF